MALRDAADQLELQRRTDAAIARASARHMSDAKWRKLLIALAALDLGPVRWKFVRDERVFEQPLPPTRAILDSSLEDVLPDPYVPYREIEWVEVPADRAAGVIEALAAIGHFPVREYPGGIRIVAYTW